METVWLVKDGDKNDIYYDEGSDEEYALVTYSNGRKVSREILDEYLKQVDESDGFDITLDLGVPYGAPIVPYRGKESTPRFLELAELAVSTFNSQNAAKYKFEKNLTVNVSYAAGMWCYITFQARNTDEAADDFNALTTFQTLAWWGIDGSRDVDFCRIRQLIKLTAQNLRSGIMELNKPLRQMP